VTCCAQERGRRRGGVGSSAWPWASASFDGHHRDRHGHSGGEATVSKVCYVEAGLAQELVELEGEQDSAGELGGCSNGTAAAQWRAEETARVVAMERRNEVEQVGAKRPRWL
jgi:hypothetical protein